MENLILKFIKKSIFIFTLSYNLFVYDKKYQKVIVSYNLKLNNRIINKNLKIVESKFKNL